jgi:hypothetical protein
MLLITELNIKMNRLIAQMKAGLPEGLVSPKLLFEAIIHVHFKFKERDTILGDFISFLELVLDHPAPLNDQETEH